MPDPISLTIAMVGLAGIGSLTKIVGGMSQSQAANANAKELERRGMIAYQDVRRETAQLLGAQRARYAKAGVDTTSGTPLEVITATAEEEELRALRAAFDYTAEAQVERQRGKQALTSSIISGVSTLLGSGMSIYSQGMSPTPSQPLGTTSMTQMPATGGPYGGFANIA